MKLFFRIIVLFIVLFTANQLLAQQIKENEVVVIKGQKFVLHEVRTGETIFSISRDFKINREVLIKNNPDIENKGLDIGEILKIPYSDNLEIPKTSNQNKPDGDPNSFVQYEITSRKETPYFLAKKYNVTVEQLYAYNPEVRKFKKGTTIRIPVWEVQPQVNETKEIVQVPQPGIENEKKLITHTVVAGETLYSLSKKYKISESEILFLNPEAKNLKAGSKIYVPFSENSENPKTAETQVAQITPETIQPSEIVSPSEYFEHIIESGETIWGLTRKYNVTENELMAINPVLKNEFPAGLVIKIPLREIVKTEVIPLNGDAFITHKVQRGETKFGLAQKYNVSIPEIENYNPALLTRNLVDGEDLIIPRTSDAEVAEIMGVELTDSMVVDERIYDLEVLVEIPESCRPENKEFANGQTVEIALFLPLFYEANDTLNHAFIYSDVMDSLSLMTNKKDTLSEKPFGRESFKRFYGGSENYLQFYEGVLLAIDSMQKQGMNITLNVFDTQNSADSIRRFIYDENFLETDLIIGPINPRIQKEVSEIAAKNRIPLVSPIASSSSEVESNPYYFQVVPTLQYQAEQTAEMVAEEYFKSNFVVVKTRNYSGTIEGKLVGLIREKLFNSGYFSSGDGVSFSEFDITNDGPSALSRVLSKTKENVLFIPSMNEGELSITISNINNLSDEYSITLIGFGRYQQRFESIEVEQFHNLKLKFIVPYWIDYQSEMVKDFVAKFKANFATEPNNYGAQGFDACFYFLNAFNTFGRDFDDCLPYYHLNLVQGNYHFQKVSAFGGFMNHGVSVISYDQDFNVTRNRIKGQPRLTTQK